MTRRRDVSAVTGYVNFPTHLPSSNEGGTSVMIVVFDNQQYKSWCHCSVPQNIIMNNEVLLRDDSLEHKLFPYMRKKDGSISDLTRNWYSIDLLASIIIGTTGWSGPVYGDRWICTFEDLTKEGKALYRLIEKLYPNCTIELLTWLDT